VGKQIGQQVARKAGGRTVFPCVVQLLNQFAQLTLRDRHQRGIAHLLHQCGIGTAAKIHNRISRYVCRHLGRASSGAPQPALLPGQSTACNHDQYTRPYPFLHF